MNMSQYMSVFIDESREHLQLLNDALLRLEKDPEDIKIVEEIFRSAHTLKGMSATMGFNRTAELTHNLENVLDKIRNKKLKVIPEIVDVLFESLDTLNLLIEEVIDSGAETTDVDHLSERLDKFSKGETESSKKKNTKKETSKEKVKEEKNVQGKETKEVGKETMEAIVFNEFEKQLIEEALSKNMIVVNIKVVLDEGCLLKAARTYMVFRNLEEVGEIIKSIPTAQDLEEEKFENNFTLAYISEKTVEEIKKAVLSVSEIKEAFVELLQVESEDVEEVEDSEEIEDKSNKAKKAKNTPPKVAGEKIKTTTTVRVDTEKLDSLMNLVAELVINKTRLSQISTEYSLQELSETLAQVDRVTSDLQAVVTKVRMVPIENVFSRFPRMVRDLSKDLHKEIELVIEGKETELDRTVIDEIGDPLVHLLRNSLDHGVEKPEERVKAGKSRQGKILLKAEHEGNSVVITISDDGKGINSKVIGAKAVEKGIVTEEELQLMTEEEIIKFIFASGFSTAAEVTDVSGRGVGMDVVRTKIEALNGQIEMSTKLGEGTIQRIKLPLTLAIIEALLIKLKEETYAIPLANIVETIDIMKSEVKIVQTEKVIVLRGEVVPIVNLGSLLEVPEYTINKNTSHTVVIVKVGTKKIGLIVDILIGQQEIVIKSLGKIFTGVRGITGATVLGNGEVALILDVLTLL